MADLTWREVFARVSLAAEHPGVPAHRVWDAADPATQKCHLAKADRMLADMRALVARDQAARLAADAALLTAAVAVACAANVAFVAAALWRRATGDAQ